MLAEGDGRDISSIKEDSKALRICASGFSLRYPDLFVFGGGPSVRPAAALEKKKDHQVRVDENTVRLSVNLSQESLELFEELKNRLSHIYPEATFDQVFSHLAKAHLKTQSDTAARSKTLRKVVITRAKGACEFRDPQTGHVCGSEYQTEVDHIRPRALGGVHEPQNLRLLCRQHNQYMAEQTLGPQWAKAWRKAFPT